MVSIEWHDAGGRARTAAEGASSHDTGGRALCWLGARLLAGAGDAGRSARLVICHLYRTGYIKQQEKLGKSKFEMAILYELRFLEIYDSRHGSWRGLLMRFLGTSVNVLFYPNTNAKPVTSLCEQRDCSGRRLRRTPDGSTCISRRRRGGDPRADRGFETRAPAARQQYQ